MRAAKEAAPAGHSGIGTTLSGNMITMSLLATNLTQVATPSAFDQIIGQQSKLSTGLRSIISKYNLPWNVTQLGARSEFQFCAESPRNGTEAEAAMDAELEQAIHLYLLNRGVMITPFHNMTLVCPDTSDADIEKFISTFELCVTELLAA